MLRVETPSEFDLGLFEVMNPPPHKVTRLHNRQFTFGAAVTFDLGLLDATSPQPRSTSLCTMMMERGGVHGSVENHL